MSRERGAGGGRHRCPKCGAAIVARPLDAALQAVASGPADTHPCADLVFACRKCRPDGEVRRQHFGILSARQVKVALTLLVAALALGALVAAWWGGIAHPVSARSDSRFDGAVGTFGSNHEGACVAFVSGAAADPGPVVLALPLEKVELKGEVKEKLAQPCSALANKVAGSFYRLHVETQSVELLLGLALDRAEPRGTPDEPMKYRWGGGEELVLRGCTSARGIHFTGWRGPALRGERVIHRYVDLGYDTNASCTDAESAP